MSPSSCFRRKSKTSHLFHHRDLSQFSYSRLNSANEHNHTKAILDSSSLPSFAPFPAWSKPWSRICRWGRRATPEQHTTDFKNTTFLQQPGFHIFTFQPLNQLCLSQVQSKGLCIKASSCSEFRCIYTLHCIPTRRNTQTFNTKCWQRKKIGPAVDKTRKGLFGTHSCHVRSLLGSQSIIWVCCPR